jgi:hypothetical protein
MKKLAVRLIVPLFSVGPTTTLHPCLFRFSFSLDEHSQFWASMYSHLPLVAWWTGD